MVLNERLRHFLADEKASYEVLPEEELHAHPADATDNGTEHELAKAVIVRDAVGHYAMAVLPADARVDLKALARTLGGRKLELASEAEFPRLLPDSEWAAIPPLGLLYGMPVCVDACCRADGEIFFRGGDHHEVVGMSYEEYARLARPKVGEFCQRGARSASK